MDKEEQLKHIFGDTTAILGNLLSPDPSGETTNECYVLLKDLAHCGGRSPAPICIMKAGTVFRKKKDDPYFTNGSELIARHVAEYSKDYFMYFSEEEGKSILPSPPKQS